MAVVTKSVVTMKDFRSKCVHADQALKWRPTAKLARSPTPVSGEMADANTSASSIAASRLPTASATPDMSWLQTARNAQGSMHVKRIMEDALIFAIAFPVAPLSIAPAETGSI